MGSDELIIRWFWMRPYVYESMMSYNVHKGKDVQKYVYISSYAKWRARRWDKSYLDDVLKSYQAMKLTDAQRQILTDIDTQHTQSRKPGSGRPKKK